MNGIEVRMAVLTRYARRPLTPEAAKQFEQAIAKSGPNGIERSAIERA
jgi:hypothetical protein